MNAKCFVFVMVCVLTSPFAAADLVITIDATNDTLTFSGDDTGVLDADGGYSWGPSFFVEGDPLELASSGLPSSGFRALIPTLTIDGTNVGIFGLDTSNAGDEIDIVGSGIAIDYSSLESASQIVLEGLVGTSLAPNFDTGGSGFSPIRVVGVPEPSGVAFLALAAFACAGLRRKR